jgi:hypothetical protein
MDRRDTAWTVLAAAVALVAHLFIAGMASAALAGTPDAILCSGMGHGAVPGNHDPGNHPRVPDCCAVGCAMVAGAAALPKLPVVFPPRATLAAVAPSVQSAVHVESHERSPINPRGPPVAA